jgi:hypothetical protein
MRVLPSSTWRISASWAPSGRPWWPRTAVQANDRPTATPSGVSTNEYGNSRHTWGLASAPQRRWIEQRASPSRKTQAPSGRRANVMRSPPARANGSGRNGSPGGSGGSCPAQSTARSRRYAVSSTPMSQSLRQHAPER